MRPLHARASSALGLLAITLAACGGGTPATDAGGERSDAFAPPGADASMPAADAALSVPAGWTLTPYLSEAPVRSFSRAEDVLVDGVDYAAFFVTDEGTMLIDLTEDQTPITVGSFVFLARNHFYDGVLFHRVIAGFMAQGGDPNTVSGAPGTWGFGGPGYQFVNEPVAALRYDARGVLGMANAGPDTNGSQFFITFAAQPSLDGGYTVFGRLLEGDATLAALAIGEPPATPSRISTIAIVER
jgi:peptidylprolyl isomerase